MSYDPAHRMPPRQERWPTATPAEGWPSYRDGEQEDLRYGAQAGYRQQAMAAAAYPAVTNDYDWSGHGYTGATDGYSAAADDFDGVRGGYGRADDGYAWPDATYAYLGPGSYVEPGAVHRDNRGRTGDPALTAPDAGVRPDRWQAEQERQREAGQRGPTVGAVTELLATGVVIGVSTLAAALLKSATSPVSAMGTVFIAHTPAALRNAVMHHFGAQGRTVLLLGMYVSIAVIAIAIGIMARRDAAAGVAGVAAFTLFAAFVVITTPASHVADVAPVVIGGLAGTAAVLWLFRASAPPAQEPARHGHGSARRRTR